MHNNNFDNTERELYEQRQMEVVKAAEALQKAKDLASDSTGKFERHIDSTTAYYSNLSDLHTPKWNALSFMEYLKTVAKIPNYYISFGGDLFNNSIVGSVGDTHTEILNGQEQVKMLASIIKEVDKQTPIMDRILFIQAGNHENRSEKSSSLNPAYLLAEALHIPHRYVKNIAEVKLHLNSDLDPSKKITTVITVSHGETLPGKATAQAQAGLNSQIDPGSDVKIYAHNHKIAVASERKQINSPKRVNAKWRDVTYANFGSASSGDEYADRANYPFPRVSDGETLRLTNVNGVKKQDFINIRSLITNYQRERLEQISKTFKTLEGKNYESKAKIEKAYQLVSNKLYNYIIKSEKNDKKELESIKNKNQIDNKIFFAPLSGFRIGDVDLKNESEIEDKISMLSKLNGSLKVVLNGDMLFYKKAITIGQGKRGEKFVEDTYSYIQELAKTLEPIKNKIISINYGEQEKKIMQFQEEELAEYALSNNQMDESLVFMPYNKQELLRAQNKIQRRQVTLYNKANLHNELDKFYLNSKPFQQKLNELLATTTENYNNLTTNEKEQLLSDTIKKYNSFENDKEYDVAIENKKSKKAMEKEQRLKTKEEKQKDFIQDFLVIKLRKAGKLLSLSKNKKQIERLFPLESIKVKKPHVNLLAHLLCDFLRIDPKNITINQVNENAYNTLKIKDDLNKTRTIALYGSSSSSNAGRSAVENHLKAKHQLAPSANVYFTNTKSGKEFVTMETTMITDETGQNKNQVDTYFISAGTFDGVSNNKIYKFYATANPKKEAEASNGIYYNVNKDFNLYCESLNYETALLEEDILQSVIVNMAKTSLKKVLVEYDKKQHEEDLAKRLERFTNRLAKQPSSSKTSSSKAKKNNNGDNQLSL